HRGPAVREGVAPGIGAEAARDPDPDSEPVPDPALAGQPVALVAGDRAGPTGPRQPPQRGGDHDAPLAGAPSPPPRHAPLNPATPYKLGSAALSRLPSRVVERMVEAAAVADAYRDRDRRAIVERHLRRI